MITQGQPQWLLFLASLTGRSANTPRVRLWRTLKELGVGTLRDGASLLPFSDANRSRLKLIAEHVISEGGTAWLFELPKQDRPTEEKMTILFDRSEAYTELDTMISATRSELQHSDEASIRRKLRQLERDLDALIEIDFFPDENGVRTQTALQELTALTNRQFSPQEPSMANGQIERLDRNEYQEQLWATRKHLWVDRVACAWLIRRFIDKGARFLWLEKPGDCPTDALGFDFDGASFTHIDDRVTFEVLQASFSIDDDPGLQKLSQLIHYLDVGGIPVAEAAGFEAVLAGLRESAVDDDALLSATSPVLDALYQRFSAITA